ncbi:cytosine permease [Tsukamurella spumae]|uniref:cytosine permease n=1 Tax=Tsukamurella spumae TaxID=44753 RepID=UPI0028B0C687|nr:cytosine permease [Tsukamurella spumae]
MASPATETPDLQYRDKIAAVEPYGIDEIPAAERHGRPVSQFFVWFAAGMNFPIMVLGFAATGFGLSLTSAVTAILCGSLVGAVVMGVLSRMGGRLGVPQQIQARGPLGFFGNFIPVAYINVFAGIGWAAVTVILGGHALQKLVPGIPYWLGTLVIVSLQLVVAVFGYNMIHFLERILAVVLFFGFLMITIVSVSRGWTGGFATNTQASGWIGGWGGWITFAGFFLSFLIAWWPFASDYSRYLPDEDSVNRATGMWTFAGNFIALSWLGIAGALLGSSAATGESPIEALDRLTGPFHVPALLIVLISSFSQNFLNVYGGAISIQTLRIPISRRSAVVLICIAAYLVNLWADENFEAKFKTFLFISAYLIAPFGAVLLLDYVLNKRHSRAGVAALFDSRRILEWGFVAWLVGAAVSSVFWNLSFYVGPVAKAHPGWGDLSYFVGFIVAGIVFLATYRLAPLWHRTADGAPAAIAAVETRPAGTTAEPPAEERIRRAWEAAWDRGEVDALDDLLSDDYRRIESGGEVRSRDEFKASIVATRTAFPDLETVIDEIIVEGSSAAIRWHSTGAHTEPFLGIPATRRAVAVNGATFARFDDGRIVEESVTWDPRALLTALGVITVGQD